VKLRASDHRYFDIDGREFISWSSFVKNFEPVFDRERISKASAIKHGRTQESVLAEWDKKRDDAASHGTRIHNALEDYSKTFQIDEVNKDLEAMMKSIMREYQEYYQCYDEECLYTNHGIAGTADKILVVSKGVNSPIDIEDFKTNLSKGIDFENKYGKYFSGPISHLSHCNYNKYSLQLSMYAYMLEEMLGRKVRKLRIRYIPPADKMQHVTLPVPYMKKEIEAMIDYWKKSVVLQPTEVDEVGFEDEPMF
jgi:hypothetical protein